MSIQSLVAAGSHVQEIFKNMRNTNNPSGSELSAIRGFGVCRESVAVANVAPASRYILRMILDIFSSRLRRNMQYICIGISDSINRIDRSIVRIRGGECGRLGIRHCSGQCTQCTQWIAHRASVVKYRCGRRESSVVVRCLAPSPINARLRH